MYYIIAHLRLCQSSPPSFYVVRVSMRFYYVHSYYADTTAPDLVAGTTTYGFPFTCAAARDNIFAVQFHPEKSQAAGLRLLANFVNWKP